MWLSKSQGTKKEGNGLLGVAIDKDKGSQHALKWALENLAVKEQTIILIHVVRKSSAHSMVSDQHGSALHHKKKLDKHTKDLFLTYHCYCTRKDIQCYDVVLEDTEIAKAITEYVSHSAIETLVLGASHHGFIKKFKPDVPSSVSKGVPDFCTVFVINKGKISSVRNACRPAPYTSPILGHIQSQNAQKECSDTSSLNRMSFRDRASKPRKSVECPSRSPGELGRTGKLTLDFSESDTDISFVSSGRPSTDRASSVLLDYPESNRTSRVSTSSEQSNGSMALVPRLMDFNSLHGFSSSSLESGRTSTSYSSQGMVSEEVEYEMKRLKQELRQTMDMYSTACKEALTAKQKATELSRWRIEEEQRLEAARVAEESAMSIVEREKAKCQAAMETAEAARRIAELESQRRLGIEMRALEDKKEMMRVLDSLAQSDNRYRRYTIEDIEAATEFFSQKCKVGEGGYGPVYKCYLDHTPVAVKVLRPDAAQGRLQFQQEIEVLSNIRHPNMVLLLGACPEYGILVYEYMARGSLEDRLFCRGNTPVLSWQLRFRIAAEIGAGLLFLHQTKPEPIVHRDLKPGNILLDQNYVCKISDVGLARLLPAVAENVTQYCMTSTAGTFCYIDPEYQQTGMLGVKSDVYSLGIMLLQLITAKPPMGLTYHVEASIENGTFAEMLDSAVPDWPIEEALCFAKLALQCAELRRKDRPDLGKEVMAELNRLREFAEERMTHMVLGVGGGGGGSVYPSPVHSFISITQDMVSDPLVIHSGSSKSRSPKSPLSEVKSEQDEES